MVNTHDLILRTPQMRHLQDIFVDAGKVLYLVGGCVRDSVIGRDVTDVDLCTDATPQEMMKFQMRGDVKIVPTGIKYGTVTFIIGGTSYEITTFRKDITTDGRRPVVKFSSSLHEDATRRDFTMNALYLGMDGVLHDPTGCGVRDAKAGHVRFIGDPKARIKEDYLRILRFFRFTATYANRDLNTDGDGLAACAEYAAQLTRISKERITTEVLKTLAAHNPVSALKDMENCGVLDIILPHARTDVFCRLMVLAAAQKPDAIQRLAALGGDDGYLRLSKRDARLLHIYRKAMVDNGFHGGEYGYRYGAQVARSALMLRCARTAMPTVQMQTCMRQIDLACAARFPVSAQDFLPDVSGKPLGDMLKRLEHVWVQSDFQLSRDDLLRIADEE